MPSTTFDFWIFQWWWSCSNVIGCLWAHALQLHEEKPLAKPTLSGRIWQREIPILSGNTKDMVKIWLSHPIHYLRISPLSPIKLFDHIEIYHHCHQYHPSPLSPFSPRHLSYCSKTFWNLYETSQMLRNFTILPRTQNIHILPKPAWNSAVLNADLDRL